MGGACGAASCTRFKSESADMETFNQAMFLDLNAPANAGAFVLAVTWVYLGVHFPLDSDRCRRGCAAERHSQPHCRDRYMAPLFAAATSLHRALFAPLIHRGWLRS